MSFACPAAWRRACPHPSPIVSFCFSSFRLVGRLVSRLVLRCPASRGRGVLARLIVIILLVGRGSWCRDCSFRLSSRRVGRHVRLVGASRLLVSGSGEALASRFIPTVSGGAAVLVLLSRGRCLLASVPSENGVMPFSSSAFPPVSYHPMAAERGACAVSSFGSSSPASCSSLAIALASCRLFDSRRTGREAGRLLAWLLWRGSSIDVYNEYDVCDVYKRYKDTRIQGCDGYIE